MENRFPRNRNRIKSCRKGSTDEHVTQKSIKLPEPLASQLLSVVGYNNWSGGIHFEIINVA